MTKLSLSTLDALSRATQSEHKIEFLLFYLDHHLLGLAKAMEANDLRMVAVHKVECKAIHRQLTSLEYWRYHNEKEPTGVQST